MDHANVKGEKEKNPGEMPDDFRAPRDQVVKKEPSEMCPDEEPITEPIPSQSVLNIESTKVHPELGAATTEMEDDAEFWPLSGKPLFSVIFTRSHVSPPYVLPIPTKMVQKLPSTSVPVVLRYCGKTWSMVYLGAYKIKRFDRAGWKAFVIDNNLKFGYGGFFELSESSQTIIKFRVQVLKTDGLPFADDDEEGQSPETPILIDD